jgi:aspartate carbamoyltransferase
MEQFRGQSIVSISQFDRPKLEIVFDVARRMEQIVKTTGSTTLANGCVLSNVFYEPSTRTSSSFYAAMLRLGGMVVPIASATSSVAKGETLEDTVRSLQSYSDVIVLRHPQIGSAAQAAAVLQIPLLNAGDGAGEHPTQALLDAFCILREFGHIDGLTVTMLGDLKHGRTVHSLSRLLALYNVNLIYVSPDNLRMPDYVKKEVQAKGAAQQECSDIREVLAQTDVLYVTRVQKERFADLKEYEAATKLYNINPSLLEENNAKSSLRIMHPLPRVNELDASLDSDPRAAYFREMECGLYVRMALLALVLGRATYPSPKL